MPLLRPRSWLAIAASAFVLGACGGGQSAAPSPAPIAVPLSGPVPAPEPVPTQVSMAPADGAELAAGAPVVVRFSATVVPASLALDGDLAQQAVAAWSSTAWADDTLTLSPPPGGWLGSGLMRIGVTSAGGEALQAQANYQVVVPLQTFQAASHVIGQADFQAESANQGGSIPNAQTLYYPSGKAAIGPNGELFVADSGNNRVLRYTPPLPATNAAADLVLGQADFTGDTPQTTRTGLSEPTHVAILGTTLAVVDQRNRRVLLWNNLPQASGTAPDVVIGQTDFTTNAPGCGASALGGGYSSVAFTPEGKLLVVDRLNNRVLIWHQVPTANGAPADLVIGQSSFDRCAFNDDDQDGQPDGQASARTLLYPADAWSDGQRLVVSDAGNSRVLIWNHFPTTPFQPADLVLGQADFVHRTDNDDNQDGLADAAPTARTLNYPSAVHSNGVQLAVADYDNHRVLIWNRFPTAHFQSADVVVGQSTFAAFAYYDSDQDGVPDQPSARTASGPTGVLLHGKRLVVTMDGHGGSRVLIFEAP